MGLWLSEIFNPVSLKRIEVVPFPLTIPGLRLPTCGGGTGVGRVGNRLAEMAGWTTRELVIGW